LKGRFYWNKRTPEDFRKAISFFQQAIEKDPNYALAYSGLADTYSLLAAYTNEPPKELMSKAKEAALKALALDDNLAEAHASLGQIVEYYDYDFATAEKHYYRALALNPNYPTGHQWLAEHLSALKRFDEAIAEIRRALELDPLSAIINRVYGDVLTDARRFDEAIAQYQRTIELDPNFSTAHFFLGRAYEGNRMYDQAVESYTRASALSMVPQESLKKLKDVYKNSGWKEYVQANLDQLLTQAPQPSLPPFVVASFYARLGQNDEAMKWLETAYEQRDYRMTMISVSYEFDGLRSDPRFRDLVRRIGLPE
jgi:tetratricopeptide (TPR) repeat protein